MHQRMKHPIRKPFPDKSGFSQGLPDIPESVLEVDEDAILGVNCIFGFNRGVTKSLEPIPEVDDINFSGTLGVFTPDRCLTKSPENPFDREHISGWVFQTHRLQLQLRLG